MIQITQQELKQIQEVAQTTLNIKLGFYFNEDESATIFKVN
jgi:hypothetical protein